MKKYKDVTTGFIYSTAVKSVEEMFLNDPKYVEIPTETLEVETSKVSDKGKKNNKKTAEIKKDN